MVNVLIYGAGAIGSFVGYLLSADEDNDIKLRLIENVALLGRTGHIQRIRADGLRVDLPDGQRCIRFRYCFSSLKELGSSDFKSDVVLICVKTHSLRQVFNETAASGLLSGCFKDADFVLLMNGMGNREVFNLPSGRVFEGVTSIGVNFAGDGNVELKGAGITVFQEGIAWRVKQFIQTCFEEKGFEAEFARDFKRHQWSKLFVNAVINPITAITGMHNGVVLSRHLERTVRGIVHEAVSLSKVEGIEYDEGEALQLVYSVAMKTAMNTSSMLQDVQRGRETEIDAINGYLVRLAAEHGLDVPVNTAMYELVKSIGEKEDQEDKSIS